VTRSDRRSRRFLPPWLLLLLLLLAGACSDDGGTVPDGAQPDGLAADMGPDLGPPVSHKQEVDKLVKPLFDGEWTVGLVVGLVGPMSREIYAYGATKAGGPAPDEHTLFEIGSITKTFTSLVLAQMVKDGKVTLDQPVQELLPAAKVTVPEKNGIKISLKHLSTHVSGLPRMPTNFQPADWNDPYADYDANKLYAFLTGHTLTRQPGVGWLYSNVGVGLLGHALTLKAGSTYKAMVKQTITDALAMPDTVITLSTEQQQRFAQGHNDELVAMKPWGLNVLEPAGALRSTLSDMLTYVASQAGLTTGALTPAMATTHQVHYSHKDLTFDMGLAWLISDSRYHWHNGGTGGFGTFAGFDLKARTGVVVLSNAITAQSPETSVGRALLKMLAGEAYDPPQLPPNLDLPTTTLDRYVGTYVMGTTLKVEIKRKGDALYFAQEGALGELRMYAAADAEFYLRAQLLRISFVDSGQGQYDTMVLEDSAGKYTLTRLP